MTAAVPRTEGWSRLWGFGAPHYVRGKNTLCGLMTDSGKLTLTDEPDQHERPNDRKCCTHCERKRTQELKAGR